MMYAHAEEHPSTSLTDSPQQVQDVKDKLEDLIPWVDKLEDSLTKTGAGVDSEEVERLEQLKRFAPHIWYFGSWTDPV